MSAMRNYVTPPQNPALSQRSLKESLRLLASRILPHDTQRTTTPPSPLVSREGPTIIVASLMRSGTHLLLDSLFNNIPMLRRSPLFVDIDAYERLMLPVEPLNSLCGAVIKTHFPETRLAPEYECALCGLASRAVIFTPYRSPEDVRQSLAKWGMNFSPAEFGEIEHRFRRFWAQFSPTIVDFPSLLHPVALGSVLQRVIERTGLKSKYATRPVMPANSRLGVYLDKTATRIAGARAPRINTTIGYRLAARQDA